MVSTGGRRGERRDVNAVRDDISWPAAWRRARRAAAIWTPESTRKLSWYVSVGRLWLVN